MREHDAAMEDAHLLNATADDDEVFSPSLSAEEAAEHAQLVIEFEGELNALIETLKPAGKRALRLVPPPDPPGWPGL